jgi:hypothetical protein
MCLAEAAEMAGVPYTLLYYRVVTREWPIEKAVALLRRGPNECSYSTVEAGAGYLEPRSH